MREIRMNEDFRPGLATPNITGANTAGVVLCARVPIILTSRSHALMVRLASAALAKLTAERGKARLAKLNLATS